MSVVLDASALLAYLQLEPGADAVKAALGEATMATVNWAEVIEKVSPSESEAVELRYGMQSLGLTLLPLSAVQAEIAGRLRESTARFGLSLGDRACLAVGMDSGGVVYTADRVWLELGLDVEIKAIR